MNGNDPAAKIRMSVIVPSLGRAERLAACLESLAGQVCPGSVYEVIVVDDGDAGSARAVAESFRGRLDVFCLVQANAGPAAARNNGARHARGAWLVFLDDDCTAPPGWLKTLEGALTAHAGSVVGGPFRNALSDNIYSIASQLVNDMVYAHRNPNAGDVRFLASANMALPAELFLRLGGFDPGFYASEDREFCARLRHGGVALRFCPEAAVSHWNRLDLKGYVRRYYHFGRGAYRYYSTCRRRGCPRALEDLGMHLFAPAYLRRAFSGLTFRRILSLSALLGVWQAANAAGFLWEAVQRAFLRGEPSKPGLEPLERRSQ